MLKLLLPLSETGLKPHFLDKLAVNGVALPPAFFEVTEGDASFQTAYAIRGSAIGKS